jgi:hypothetical protein
VSRFARDGRANGGGRHQVLADSEWKGRCGGGRYKRSLYGGGQVIVYVAFVPILFQYFILHIEPLKMYLTEGSETSAKHNLTPGKYPKEHTQDSEHGENFKSRIFF